MSEIRSVSVRLSAKTSEYIAGMGAAARSTDSLGASLSRVEARGAAASRGLAGLKKASLYGAGAVVAGLGLAEKAAADFGEKMALVQTLSHANEQQMKRLSSAAMNAGQQIGYTANQVADGEAEMIKAGVSLRDILKGGLKGALDLAAAGQTDVATATTIAASAMTQFKLQGKDIPHLADLLAAGADKALGSVEDLGYGLSQAGTTAHQMGIGVNETVGTLAAFAQAGLIGERGGTTFKQMLLQLASPAKNAAQIMKDYGLSLYNANGQIKTMPQLADNLRQSFDRLTPAQRNAALGTIFGSRAIQGANILMAEGGKGIAEWIRKVNDQGFAAHQASGKLNSLKGDLSKFKAEVQDDLINLGTGSQSPLRNLVQGATRELHKLRTNGDLKRWGNEISDTFTTIGRDALPIAKEVGHALGIIGHDLGAVAKGFQKLPDGLQQAIVTGGVVAYGAHKLGVDSLLKGALGAGGRGSAAGALTGRAGAVPVYVTNWRGKGGPGGSGGPRGIPVPGGSTPKVPTHLGIPEHFWDLTKTGARDLLSSSLGKVSGEGLLKGALRGLLGAPAWISAGDAGNEVRPGKSLGPNAFSSMLAAAGAEKAAKNTKAWADAQAALNTLLLGPALPKYAARLTSLPEAVQTKIATPGAVQSVADVAKLARQYNLTPKQVRTLIELAGAGKVKSDAIAIGRLYNLTPKQVRTLISQAGMDSSQAQIRRLANLYNLTPKQVRTIVTANTGNAAAAIARIRSMLAGIPRSISTSYYVNQINSVSKAPSNFDPTHGKYGADGTTVPKTGRAYADRHLYMLADGEEVVSNRRGQADRHRPILKAINADMPREQIRGMLAAGGTAGWGTPSWSGDWKMPPAHTPPKGNWMQQILTGFFKNLGGPSLGQEIRKLKDELKDGTRQINELSKARKGESKSEKAAREREVKALERHQKALEKASAQLEAQRTAVNAFSLSSVLPTVEPKNPILAGTRAELHTLQHELTKAGGKWTGAMQDDAHGLLVRAKRLDDLNRRTDTLATRYEKQTQVVADATSALDSMRQTAQQFGDSVSAQFATGLFGLTDSGGFAQTATPSSVISSLTSDSSNLAAFLKATNTLAGEGLDKSVLSELYSKGDLSSALSLASASSGDIAGINTAAASRAALQAQLSSAAGSNVYGTDVAQAQAILAAATTAQAATATLQTQVAHQVTAVTSAIRDAVQGLKSDVKVTVYLDGKKLGAGMYDGVAQESKKRHNQTTRSGLAT